MPIYLIGLIVCGILFIFIGCKYLCGMNKSNYAEIV